MPGVILPRKAVAALAQLLDEEGGTVGVAVSPTKFRFEIGKTVLTGKRIDGQFPDYTHVITTGNKAAAWSEPGPLAEEVDRDLTTSTGKNSRTAVGLAGQ